MLTWPFRNTHTKCAIKEVPMRFVIKILFVAISWGFSMSSLAISEAQTVLNCLMFFDDDEDDEELPTGCEDPDAGSGLTMTGGGDWAYYNDQGGGTASLWVLPGWWDNPSSIRDNQGNISLPGVWSYSSSVQSGPTITVTGTEYNFLDTNTSPQRYSSGVTFSSLIDAKGHLHSYGGVFKPGLDLSPRIVLTQFAGGGSTLYAYDERGNVEAKQFKAAFSGDLITLETGYEETCSNIVTCNKPSFKKDALGNQTDYTYDPVHGGILTETGPAVDGVRPQTRYTYATYQARYKNASGSVVASGQDIYLLTSEAYCISTNADPSGTGCVGGATDEVVMTYDYGPTTGANNLWLRGTTVTADGQSLTTCNQYDDFGNMIAQTAPKSDITSCY